MECRLSARPSAECSVTSHFISVRMTLLQRRKLRVREVESFVQNHTAGSDLIVCKLRLSLRQASAFFLCLQALLICIVSLSPFLFPFNSFPLSLGS